MKRDISIHERLSRCARMTTEEIFREMDVSSEGLRSSQVEYSREHYGRNEVSEQEKDTVLRRLSRAFVNPFTVILLILALLSFLTCTVFSYDTGRSIGTTILILVMLLVSGGVRFFEEMRARRLTGRLVQLVDTTVQVCRDGVWRQLDCEELVVGDLVRLDAGDRVPADIRLISVKDFFISQSVLTGESGILEKTARELESAPEGLGDYTNMVFLGSTVTGGICEGLVLAVGEDTVYGGLSLDRQGKKNGFTRGENDIAWVLIRFMVLLVPVVFVVCGLTKGDWLEAFLFALSVGVGLTPELLPMVITACMAKGSVTVSHEQIVVKDLNAMQSFGSMDVLCVDKTGTLTGDTVQLEYYMDILGNESIDVLNCAYLNSFYHTGLANHLDKAILKAESMPGREAYFAALPAKFHMLDELPFDYERRFASVLLRVKKAEGNPKESEKEETEGNLLLVKGSVREVVERCSWVRYRGERIPFDAESPESVREVVEAMLEEAMKVLAVASRRLPEDTLVPEDENDLELLGYLAFFDAPKQSAVSALKKWQDLKIDVKVLTGDHADVAASVCRRLGVATDPVRTGRECDALSDEALSAVAERGKVFAELSPKQKVRLVKSLQEDGHVVGILGDGMNDLPAVVQSDVGISVDTAMEAVKDSADVILLKKDLDVLDDGVAEGRKVFANMSKYVEITSSSNFGNILAIVIASVLLPFLPMASVQILLLNLVYDVMCLVLPWDNVDPELCTDPLRWSGDTMGRFMLFFGPISTLFDLLTYAFLFFVLCPRLCGGAYASLSVQAQAEFISLFQTGWFLESLWTQVLILYLLRTDRKWPWQSRPSKQMILVTLLAIVLCSVLTATPLGLLFGQNAMPVWYVGFLILVVILYMALVTLAKQLYRKRYGSIL